ncbi:MAG TPA: ROK family protein [Gemmataceae bacterium]|nr:ROK family protein [Gemmataceae bacterium]
MTILTLDVGGTHVKLKLSGQDEVRKFESGPGLTPQQMIDGVRAQAPDWTYDVVSMGFPAPVVGGKIVKEPVNLGPGWVGFDLAAALGKPVRIINDAAMQALGGYQGGRMLFLGLGTGLGTTLIVDGVVVGMELGHLPYRKRLSFEDYVGVAGLERRGREKWQAAVFDVVEILKTALVAEYVLLGGGNVKKLTTLPPGAVRGDNADAFRGGERLWSDKPAAVGAPQEDKNGH